ncbi:FG-GAP repeat protein [Engelhardtia mirabilis]|uniref:FG-GAP repeat protein n=1 Tax=Engelhardtia mirabilis TaxID=2528011 RepID=A0A518BEG9_9BACT|nr:hypothetical protein Pla133_04500 [Planctomycetes bacterium Pla133]QDU99711.1 hypothetical protein Pla86_04500 [Planctomycetes bacterium Pla86]
MQLRLLVPLALGLACGAGAAAAQSYTLATLSPQDTSADDLIGSACDVSGTTAIVGGYGHDDGGTPGTGAAWIFDRVAGGDWSESVELQPADGLLSTRFGWAVAIDGDVAMVGAYRDDTLFNDAGSVYVYTRQGSGTWLQTGKLAASDATAGAEFGHAVSIDGNFAVVGAPGAKSGFETSGAGYVFERQPDDSWLEIAKLASDDNLGNDELGFDASISGSRVVLGAHLQDDNGNSSGAAYVYERQNDGTWLETAKLLASDGVASDYFGYSVAVSGDNIVCGAWLDDDFGSGTGSAYVFELQAGNTWLEVAKLLPGINQSNGHFGQSVAIDGDYALIGAIHQIVNFKLDAGAAYGFRRDGGGGWPLVQSYFYDDIKSDQNFGHCVALDDGVAVIGSSDNDEFAFNGGLAQVFYTYEGSSDPAPVVQGAGTPGCNGPQVIGLALPAQIDTAGFGFTCTNAPASSTGFLLVGNVADITGSDILGLGVTLHVNVLLSTPTLLLDFASDASGNGLAPVPLPNSPSLVGAVLHAQAVWAWSSCVLPPLNLSSSNLVSFTISAP